MGWFDSFWPSPPHSAGESPKLSFGITLFIEAQASISMPSTKT
ncbi:hypothetical protein MEA186_26866 [Mesorhizobium amorphae CCNWGS0123]|uniref:Uncharacterized protein n=1 Tax=Mesorhizobium amorphae CCNWGS0123 TaxID=1082933 RepID=G6YHA6_9HYPH|nr:hypothetical protein MEA186_26866 [Mesorhizobium amorphae CCNWGS0123]